LLGQKKGKGKNIKENPAGDRVSFQSQQSTTETCGAVRDTAVEGSLFPQPKLLFVKAVTGPWTAPKTAKKIAKESSEIASNPQANQTKGKFRGTRGGKGKLFCVVGQKGGN